MKKIIIIFVFALLLVGCGTKEFELELKDPMNCIKQIYQKGNTTYHTSYETIIIRFEQKEYSLTEAIDKKIVTMEDIYKKANGGITKCGKGDTKYPCGGGCAS